MNELIEKLFAPAFQNSYLKQKHDGSAELCARLVKQCATEPLAPTLRSRDAELLADRAGDSLLDFAVPRYSGAATVHGIAVDGVVGAFAVQVAAVGLEVPHQVATLHAAGTSTVMVSQMAVPAASLAAFSRYA